MCCRGESEPICDCDFGASPTVEFTSSSPDFDGVIVPLAYDSANNRHEGTASVCDLVLTVRIDQGTCEMAILLATVPWGENPTGPNICIPGDTIATSPTVDCEVPIAEFNFGTLSFGASACADCDVSSFSLSATLTP